MYFSSLPEVSTGSVALGFLVLILKIQTSREKVRRLSGYHLAINKVLFCILISFLSSFLPRFIFFLFFVSFSLHLCLLTSPPYLFPSLMSFYWSSNSFILFCLSNSSFLPPQLSNLGDCSLCSGKRRGVTLRCWGFRNRDIGVEAWESTKYKIHIYYTRLSLQFHHANKEI